MTKRTSGASVADSPTSILSWVAAAVALTLLLLWPAFYNGQPLFFPDSIGYERAGAVTLAATHIVEEPDAAATARDKITASGGGDGVTTARSPFYGVPFTLAIDAGGVWAVAVLQSLGVVTALLMAMRRLRLPLATAVATAAVLALAGGLAVYAEALLPDVFLGLMVLGFAMLLAVPRLPRLEQCLWLFAIVVAMLFHKAFLAVGFVLTIGAAIAARRLIVDRATVTLLAACCVAGLCGHILVDFSIRQVTGQAPLRVPFMLARYAASPVLSSYLRDNCSPPAFVICRYRARLPMAPDDFLWGAHSVYASVPSADRRAISVQADTVLRGAIMARPVAAAVEAVRGAAVQLVTVGMADFGLGVPATTRIDSRLASAIADYPASAIARRTFPLRPLGTLALALYLIGAVAIAAALPMQRRRGAVTDRSDRPRLAVLTGVIVGGVVANAVVSGMLSGVFERYQGRIAWLLPFGAIMLWQSRSSYARSAALAL